MRTAQTLECWQEAFKTAIDINEIINNAPYLVENSHLTQYYAHVAEIFWKANNYLLHARALLHLLNLKSTQEDFTKEEESMYSRLFNTYI